MLSCKYWEILKNTFFTGHLRTTASIPFKENYPLIHDNFHMCKERLLKLQKKVILKSCRNIIFEEQKRLGIIETVSEPGKKGKYTL